MGNGAVKRSDDAGRANSATVVVVSIIVAILLVLLGLISCDELVAGLRGGPPAAESQPGTPSTPRLRRGWLPRRLDRLPGVRRTAGRRAGGGAREGNPGVLGAHGPAESGVRILDRRQRDLSPDDLVVPDAVRVHPTAVARGRASRSTPPTRPSPASLCSNGGRPTARVSTHDNLRGESEHGTRHAGWRPARVRGRGRRRAGRPDPRRGRGRLLRAADGPARAAWVPVDPLPPGRVRGQRAR